jgi:ankyrin repeat protein
MKNTPLLNCPLDASMGPKVLEILSRMENLPQSGCVAGQAVTSVLLQLFAQHPEHTGPIKDIDVFHTRFDRLLESGALDGSKEESLSLLKSQPLNKSDYGHIFEQRLNVGRVLTKGKLNLIEMIPSNALKVDCAAFTPADRLDTVIAEFDLTCVQVGVDLKTGELRWTDGFERFIQGEPVQASNVALAERTLVRMDRKSKEMPWMQWNTNQIQVALQLAQMRNALAIHDHPQKEKLMANWTLRYDQNIREVRQPLSLEPIWQWPEWQNPSLNDHKKIWSALRQRMDRQVAGMPSESQATAQFMIALMDNYKKRDSNGNGPGSLIALAQATESQKDKDVARTEQYTALSDPLTTLFKLRPWDEKTLIQHLIDHPDGLFCDVPTRPRKWNAELMKHAIENSLYGLIDHLLDAGFPPNLPMGFHTPYSSLMSCTAPRSYATSRMNKKELEQSEIFHRLLHKMVDLGANVTTINNCGQPLAHFLIKNVSLETLQQHIHRHSPQDWMTPDAEGVCGLHPLMRNDFVEKRALERQGPVEIDPDMDDDDDSFSRAISGQPAIVVENKSAKERLNFLLPLLQPSAQQQQMAQAAGLLHEVLNPQEKRKDSLDVEEVKEVLRTCWAMGLAKDQKTDQRSSMLFHAIASGDQPLFDFLIESGLDVNARDDQQNTPLMVAARGGGSRDNMLIELMKRGADINAMNERKENVLLCAMAKDNEFAVQALIKEGANPDVLLGKDGLHIAEISMVNRPPMVQMIFSALDPELGDRMTPLAMDHANNSDSSWLSENEAVLQSRMAKRAIDRCMDLSNSPQRSP